MAENIRLDKLLSNMGLGTRSEIKKKIKAGKVAVDGEIVKNADIKVSSDSDITFEGGDICYKKQVYYMLNKPAGCVCAREDDINDTVFKYIKDKRKGLSPIGRLDKDTEGLLLITDDGDFNHLLMSPAHHVSKTYEAVIDGKIDEKLIEYFKEGVDIGDEKPCKPSELEIIENTDDKCLIRLTIYEGRYHQVKRMFEAFGRTVVYLKRLRIGNLSLDESLNPGDYRELTVEEVDGLKKCENLL